MKIRYVQHKNVLKINVPVLQENNPTALQGEGYISHEKGLWALIKVNTVHV